MLERLKDLIEAIRDGFASRAAESEGGSPGIARRGAERVLSGLAAARAAIIVAAVLGATGYLLYRHPPMQSVGRGEIGIRTNRLTGGVSEWRDGSVFAFPGLHELRLYSLRDRTYRPENSSRASGPAPLQSVEGLSLGVDL